MEKRNYSRTALISDYNTEFRLGGQTYSKVRVSNIGTNGCCLQMPVGTAKYLSTKPQLENMILFHSDAKKYSLKGKVAWVEELKNPKAEWITAGVEFLETPAECTREISEYVVGSHKK